MLPSTWLLVIFWGFVAMITLAWLCRKFTHIEGLVLLAIMGIMGFFFLPIYAQQRHREERAEWIRTHPHSKPPED